MFICLNDNMQVYSGWEYIGSRLEVDRLDGIQTEGECERCKCFGAKWANQPQNSSKNLVRKLAGTGKVVSLFTVKGVLYRPELKSHSARRKPLFQTTIRKPDYSFKLHMRTKILIFFFFLDISCDLMKLKIKLFGHND